MTNEERALKLAMQIDNIGTLDCGRDDCSACPRHRADATALVLAYADEIRAEAAEKAVAAFNEWALNRIIIDKYKLVEGCTMIDSAITGKEPKK